MDAQSLAARIEALLFVYGEPLDIERIARILSATPNAVTEGIQILRTTLKNDQRGITLLEDADGIQLVTKPEHGSLIETIIKEEIQENLTPAALETLSIIAYASPIARSEIEYIRGVNSSFTLRNLILRGLIERMADPRRANAYVYRPSIDFLKHIGLSRVDDLPEFSQFQELVRTLWKKDESHTVSPKHTPA